MSKYKLIIKADTNDADYVESTNEIDAETLEELKPLFVAIKNFKPYRTKGTGQSKLKWTHESNFPYGDGEYVPRFDLGEKSVDEIYAGIVTPDQLETFKNFCPYGENGIHTIKNITVVEYIDEKEYL